jgi:DNA-directed RNA polymerase subunit RPC12/RpoP
MKKTNKKMLTRQYCNSKIMYDKKGAITMINYLKRKGREEYLRAYQCPDCNMWHITHKEEV